MVAGTMSQSLPQTQGHSGSAARCCPSVRASVLGRDCCVCALSRQRATRPLKELSVTSDEVIAGGKDSGVRRKGSHNYILSTYYLPGNLVFAILLDLQKHSVR